MTPPDRRRRFATLATVAAVTLAVGACGSRNQITKAEALVERTTKSELEQRDVSWDATPTATCERKSELRITCFATTNLAMTDDAACATLESEHEVRIDRKDRMTQRTISVEESSAKSC